MHAKNYNKKDAKRNVDRRILQKKRNILMMN